MILETCDLSTKQTAAPHSATQSSCLINSLQAIASAASELVAAGNVAAGEAGPELETEGACGWSKPQMSLELSCGGQMKVREYIFQYHLIIINSNTLICGY